MKESPKEKSGTKKGRTTPIGPSVERQKDERRDLRKGETLNQGKKPQSILRRKRRNGKGQETERQQTRKEGRTKRKTENMKGTTPTKIEDGTKPGKRGRKRENSGYRDKEETGNILLKPDKTTGVDDEGARKTEGTRPNGRSRC